MVIFYYTPFSYGYDFPFTSFVDVTSTVCIHKITIRLSSMPALSSCSTKALNMIRYGLDNQNSLFITFYVISHELYFGFRPVLKYTVNRSRCHVRSQQSVTNLDIRYPGAHIQAG